ncbi:MAG: hypothetical protein ABI972_14875 [Acidobacteriota bacterium]
MLRTVGIVLAAAGILAVDVNEDLLAAGKVCVATEDGDVYVLKAGTTYELLAKNMIGAAILATPALTDDVLFVLGAKHLFAMGVTPNN